MLLESLVLYLVSLYGDESAREGGRGKVRYARLSLSVCVTARACGSGLGFLCVGIGFSRVLRSQESYKSVTLLLFVLLMCVCGLKGIWFQVKVSVLCTPIRLF